MRDRVLLLGRHLCERPAVEAVGGEHRVVAESPVTPGCGGDGPGDLAFHPQLLAVGPGHEGDTAEPGPPVVRRAGAHPVEFGHQLGHVVGVTGPLARVPRRVDARLAPERLHLEAGVVGHGRQSGGLAQGDGLQPGVVLEGLPRLLDVGHLRGPGHERQVGDATEDGGDLRRLVLVGTGQHERLLGHPVPYLSAEPADRPTWPSAGRAGGRFRARPGSASRPTRPWRRACPPPCPGPR